MTQLQCGRFQSLIYLFALTPFLPVVSFDLKAGSCGTAHVTQWPSPFKSAAWMSAGQPALPPRAETQPPLPTLLQVGSFHPNRMQNQRGCHPPESIQDPVFHGVLRIHGACEVTFGYWMSFLLIISFIQYVSTKGSSCQSYKSVGFYQRLKTCVHRLSFS